MPRGYRHIVLAIGLVLYASLAYSQDLPDATLESEPISEPRQAEGAAAGEQNAQSEDRQPPDYTSAFERIEAAIRDLIPEVDKEESQRQENREIADLSAQQDMAFWAKRMYWATVAAVIVTFVGVGLVGWTLHHTRRAADYAKDMVGQAKLATATANETVDVTRDIGQRQIRAYIGVGKCDFLLEKNVATAIAEFINAGATPATEVRILCSLGFETGNESRYIQAQAHFGSGPPPGSVATLGAGRKAKPDASMLLTDEQIAALDDGNARVVFSVTLTYADVFGRRWAQDLQFANGKGYLAFTRDGPMAISKFNQPERQITDA